MITGAVTDSVVTELPPIGYAAGGTDAEPIEAAQATTAAGAIVELAFPSHISL